MRSEADAAAKEPALNESPSISTVLLMKTFPGETQFAPPLVEVKTTLFEPLATKRSWPNAIVFNSRPFVGTFVADHAPTLNKLVPKVVLKVAELAPTATRLEFPSYA